MLESDTRMRGEDMVERESAIDAESRADERRNRVARHRSHGRDRDRADGRAAGEGHVNHMGVQLPSRDDVVTQLERVKAAGLPVREEFGVDCCHANQDKFWVEDPDGVEWEVYVLNHDLEDESPALERESQAPRGLRLAKAATCCAPGT